MDFFSRQVHPLQVDAHSSRAYLYALLLVQRLAQLLQGGVRVLCYQLAQNLQGTFIKARPLASTVRPGRYVSCGLVAAQQSLHERTADTEGLGKLSLGAYSQLISGYDLLA